jgi:hypothetical protein
MFRIWGNQIVKATSIGIIRKIRRCGSEHGRKANRPHTKISIWKCEFS